MKTGELPMEKLLNDDVITQLNNVFGELQEPVSVLYFGKEADCEYCDTTRQLAEEVTSLSDLLHFAAHDVESDHEIAGQYKVDKTPGLVIAAKNDDEVTDYGVRYSGVPSGHEFTSLVHDIINVSKRQTTLSEETREFLQGITEPVHMQVFVTPTCPYCPQAVVLAHQMAMENPLITAEMVEATEFPELSMRFNVSGVPQTTINDGAATVIGAAPEVQMVSEIRKALGLN
jgi:glutaredoxin-like protein